MTVLLVFLLALAISGLAFLGLYAFQLRTRCAHLDFELIAEQDRYDKEIKQWNDFSVTVKARHQGLVNKYNEDARKWNEYSAALKAENQRLSRWKNVTDADAKAAEMLRTARATLEKAKADANNLVATAQQRAASLQAEADQKAAAELANAKDTASTVALEAMEKSKTLRDEAQAFLNSATTQAAQVIEAANKKAEEIAGSAYEAMKNASHYEQTVKAMKNIIAGYGDQYIIPPQSLLDDLAEDFSHTQAGRELKRARECTKVMIRNGTAAACEYVEANRRETAISFVVDAFNGKVDSILSRVRHDNSGRLDQQIRDAFALVNNNGKAFRDARIKEEYLAARLDELKWAAIAQQFALQDREEQRHAKEQAREEARADKERERALREADKEEQLLRKAMDQAQEQFEQASGEQKAMYEERIQEMAEKLKQAHEQKERARSMAEQTKKGYVYIISNIGSFGDDVYKIGLTRRLDPRDRVDELGGASVPYGFDVHATILSDDAPALEQKLHSHFVLLRMNKVNHRKEFFRVSLKEIHEQTERLGLKGVNWTMTAQAREYRESLATEKLFMDKPAMREAWIKRQLDMEFRTNDVLEPVGASAEED
jgi:DNA repair exonuclease SbcCD ATPase subunit